MAKRTKKKTFAEFISWLEGVESMQEPDWTPNQNQWKTIREMLKNVIPDTVEVEVESQQPQQPVAQFIPQQYYPAPPQQPPVPMQEEHSQISIEENENLEGQSGLELQSQEPHRRRVPSGVSNRASAVRTTKRDEVLDTSSGQYESEYM